MASRSPSWSSRKGSSDSTTDMAGVEEARRRRLQSRTDKQRHRALQHDQASQQGAPDQGTPPHPQPILQHVNAPNTTAHLVEQCEERVSRILMHSVLFTPYEIQLQRTTPMGSILWSELVHSLELLVSEFEQLLPLLRPEQSAERGAQLAWPLEEARRIMTELQPLADRLPPNLPLSYPDRINKLLHPRGEPDREVCRLVAQCQRQTSLLWAKYSTLGLLSPHLLFLKIFTSWTSPYWWMMIRKAEMPIRATYLVHPEWARKDARIRRARDIMMDLQALVDRLPASLSPIPTHPIIDAKSMAEWRSHVRSLVLPPEFFQKNCAGQ